MGFGSKTPAQAIAACTSCGVGAGVAHHRFCRLVVEPDSSFITTTTSGRDAFATGSVRGDRAGKGRYDLLPREAIHRLAQLYERGADHYGDRNWELGQPFSRVLDSMLRHAFQAAAGMTDEDHLAAVMWNAAALITLEDRVARGDLPADLDDRPNR